MVVFINCLEVVTFLIPLILIINNYARTSYTLMKSLKENVQLIEGTQPK